MKWWQYATWFALMLFALWINKRFIKGKVSKDLSKVVLYITIGLIIISFLIAFYFNSL